MGAASSWLFHQGTWQASWTDQSTPCPDSTPSLLLCSTDKTSHVKQKYTNSTYSLAVQSPGSISSTSSTTTGLETSPMLFTGSQNQVTDWSYWAALLGASKFSDWKCEWHFWQWTVKFLKMFVNFMHQLSDRWHTPYCQILDEPWSVIILFIAILLYF